jgi:16S rRNA (cytosine967-C5)-methyltransferase
LRREAEKTLGQGFAQRRVLRSAQRESEAILAELEHDPVVRTAHPRWLQKSLKAFWPEQWEAICEANNAHPPMILRVNRRHHST